jgi:HAD superfamily hydrolase (TIGR01549 family)
MKRPAALRAVVFDLDGTLVDSLPLVLQSIAHGIQPFGPRPTMEIFGRLGGPPERFLPTLLDDIAHVPEALARMEAFHRANSHLIQPFTSVAAALQRLRGAGLQLGIWTGRDRASTEPLLRSFAMESWFGAVVCGDDFTTHKPNPEGLREIVRRFGVLPTETLFVGDADVDVLGGVGCGVDTILIRHGREIAADVTALAWRSVSSPAEALELVLSCVDLGRIQVSPVGAKT